MANQPGRGGAAARHAAALPNAGQGSLAPPEARDTSTTDNNPGGLVHMTSEVYFARYGAPAAPLPASSVQSPPPQQERTPSPEPPSPAKRSCHGSPISSRVNTPTPQPSVRDVSMGPPPGDTPIEAGPSSSNPTPPSHFSQALTGHPDQLLRETELVQDMVQHITAWFAKVDEINISDTSVTREDIKDLSEDMEKLAHASFDSELLAQREEKTTQAEDEDDDDDNPSSQHFDDATGDDDMYVPTGPTTPPRAGQSTDVDMSATAKASRKRPANPAQPSGPSRADKGKQPVCTNPVAVQRRPQPKKPMVSFQCMGVPPPINRATKPSRKLYSSVAKSAPASQPVTVAELARVAPHLPVDNVTQAYSRRGTGRPARKRKIPTPNFTTQGPSRKQILITFSGLFITCDLGLFLARACDALDTAKIKLTLLAMTTAYGGYSISTAEVPHPAAHDVICGFAMQIFKTDAMYVGLPTSTSYIRIIDVPFFEDNACTQRVSLDRIKGALVRSPLHEHLILARDPRLVPNSPNSTNCTVNIDLWDSQTDAHAKALIGKSLMMGNRLCLIKEAQPRKGVSICQRCWKWGHPSQSCRSPGVTCPHCMGPHMANEHC